MTTIRVKLRRSSVAGKPGAVYYLLVHRSKTLQITTRFKLYPSEWDERWESVVLSGSEQDNKLQDVQSRIQCDRAILRGIIRMLEDSSAEYTVKDVAEAFRNSTYGVTFFAFMDEQIKFLLEHDRLGTSKNYQHCRRSFSDFLQGADITFHAFTEDLMLNYEYWLKKREVSRNTISFYMRILRSVYNKAVVARVAQHNNHPFEKVYTGIDRTSKRAVNEEIIVRIKRLDLSHSRTLSYTRDLFMFSFYTRGMAFVDMAYLRKSNLKNGVLQYVRRKTGQTMSIRMEPCIQEIIDRYAHQSKSSCYLLPILYSPDQDMAYQQYLSALSYYNKQLKRISDLLELTIPLSSYISRHTWATTARNRNIPLSVISAGMGHISEATTKIYLASLEASVVDEANHLVIAGLL